MAVAAAERLNFFDDIAVAASECVLTCVQVLHSARNDGEALHAQFGVGLRNVHDTQLAHMEVERAEGRTFPQRLKLEEICEIYCPDKAEMLREGKDAIQVKYTFPQNEVEVWQNCGEGEKEIRRTYGKNMAKETKWVENGPKVLRSWKTKQKNKQTKNTGQKCCKVYRKRTKNWEEKGCPKCGDRD